jgi:hypothetical protein
MGWGATGAAGAEGVVSAQNQPMLSIVQKNYWTKEKRRSSLYVDGLRVAEISGEKEFGRSSGRAGQGPRRHPAAMH